jgi:putative membrane protein
MDQIILVLKDEKLRWQALMLFLLHGVGILGLISFYQNYFLQATFLNLLITAIILLKQQEGWSHQLILYLAWAYLLTFFLEVVGVASGSIFGEYSYGNSLGYKILEVPVIIGLNWVVLVYSCGIIADKLPLHWLFKSILGALMLVFLDFLIEPVAMQLDFWNWQNGIIPMQNYIAWFLIGFTLLVVFYQVRFNRKNRLAIFIYLVQFVFFAILNVYFWAVN